MSRPRLLDLFCGAGGASMGYSRAGFDVVGVDINPQPHYPFEFHQGDWEAWAGPGFDAIHASPPCQAYSTMGNRHKLERPRLIAEVLSVLEAHGIPYVVENVMGARSEMPNAMVLSGRMFGLGVHRPRLFLSNVLLMAPPPMPSPENGVGVYGRSHDGRRVGKRGQTTGITNAASSLVQAQEAMGMDWADWHGTKEAIPPAYTEFIGAQLLQHLGVQPIP